VGKRPKKTQRRKLYNQISVAILAQAFLLDSIFCVCSLLGLTRSVFATAPSVMAFPVGASFGGFAAESDGVSGPRAAPQFEEVSPHLLPTTGGDGGTVGAASWPGNAFTHSAAPNSDPRVMMRPLSLDALAGTARTPKPVLEGYCAALGCEPTDTVEDFLFVPPDELTIAMHAFKVGDEPATSFQKGQITRFVAAAYALAPGPRTITEIVQASAATPPSTKGPPASTQPKRKYAEVLDQSDDATYEELAPSRVTELRAEHVRITGGAPPEDARPTSEQLSALAARLGAKRAPFADFAIWGAFGRRAAKMLKYTAQVFVEGSLQTRMLKGPIHVRSLEIFLAGLPLGYVDAARGAPSHPGRIRRRHPSTVGALPGWLGDDLSRRRKYARGAMGHHLRASGGQQPGEHGSRVAVGLRAGTVHLRSGRRTPRPLVGVARCLASSAWFSCGRCCGCVVAARRVGASLGSKRRW